MAHAQQKPIPGKARLGWLAHGDIMPRHFFDDALVRLGWIEGKNLKIERRFAGSAGERLTTAAAELVAQHPDVIVALGIADAQALLQQTHAIPIVLVLATNDVIRQGLAGSLAHPGGSVTGAISIAGDLVPKLVELAHELIPGARRVSVLIDPRKDPEPDARVGAAIGIKLVSRHATRPDELDTAFAAASSDGDQAIVVQFNAITIEERARVIALASRFRLPAIYAMREFIEAGGLISYGPVIRDNFERAAALVDKILRGARPADLPIEQPTKFELVINLKTAKALGLTVPQSIFTRADEVIE
jgi:ABC-type uncharacterized transport system substrate-binding protein